MLGPGLRGVGLGFDLLSFDTLGTGLRGVGLGFDALGPGLWGVISSIVSLLFLMVFILVVGKRDNHEVILHGTYNSLLILIRVRRRFQTSEFSRRFIVGSRRDAVWFSSAR